MNKMKILGAVVVLLIIVNSIILSLFILKTKENKLPHFPREISEHERHQRVKDLFEFDDTQMHLYLLSKRIHGDSLFNLNMLQKKISIKYYNVVDVTGDKVSKEKLLDKLTHIDIRIHRANLSHLSDIEKICTDSQKVHLDDFIQGLLHIGEKRLKKSYTSARD